MMVWFAAFLLMQALVSTMYLPPNYLFSFKGDTRFRKDLPRPFITLEKHFYLNQPMQTDKFHGNNNEEITHGKAINLESTRCESQDNCPYRERQDCQTTKDGVVTCNNQYLGLNILSYLFNLIDILKNQNQAIFIMMLKNEKHLLQHDLNLNENKRIVKQPEITDEDTVPSEFKFDNQYKNRKETTHRDLINNRRMLNQPEVKEIDFNHELNDKDSLSNELKFDSQLKNKEETLSSDLNMNDKSMLDQPEFKDLHFKGELVEDILAPREINFDSKFKKEEGLFPANLKDNRKIFNRPNFKELNIKGELDEDFLVPSEMNFDRNWENEKESFPSDLGGNQNIFNQQNFKELNTKGELRKDFLVPIEMNFDDKWENEKESFPSDFSNNQNMFNRPNYKELSGELVEDVLIPSELNSDSHWKNDEESFPSDFNGNQKWFNRPHFKELNVKGELDKDVLVPSEISSDFSWENYKESFLSDFNDNQKKFNRPNFKELNGIGELDKDFLMPSDMRFNSKWKNFKKSFPGDFNDNQKMFNQPNVKELNVIGELNKDFLMPSDMHFDSKWKNLKESFPGDFNDNQKMFNQQNFKELNFKGELDKDDLVPSEVSSDFSWENDKESFLSDFNDNKKMFNRPNFKELNFKGESDQGLRDKEILVPFEMIVDNNWENEKESFSSDFNGNQQIVNKPYFKHLNVKGGLEKGDSASNGFRFDNFWSNEQEPLRSYYRRTLNDNRRMVGASEDPLSIKVNLGKPKNKEEILSGNFHSRKLLNKPEFNESDFNDNFKGEDKSNLNALNFDNQQLNEISSPRDLSYNRKVEIQTKGNKSMFGDLENLEEIFVDDLQHEDEALYDEINLKETTQLRGNISSELPAEDVGRKVNDEVLNDVSGSQNKQQKVNASLSNKRKNSSWYNILNSLNEKEMLRNDYDRDDLVPNLLKFHDDSNVEAELVNNKLKFNNALEGERVRRNLRNDVIYAEEPGIHVFNLSVIQNVGKKDQEKKVSFQTY